MRTLRGVIIAFLALSGICSAQQANCEAQNRPTENRRRVF
jgi:hypothetical protein